jgi:hypothetical protein
MVTLEDLNHDVYGGADAFKEGESSVTETTTPALPILASPRRPSRRCPRRNRDGGAGPHHQTRLRTT